MNALHRAIRALNPLSMPALRGGQLAANDTHWVAPASRGKILLATIGSLGDLHPFIAIGLELKALGYTPLLGVPASYVDKVRAAGLPAIAIMPPFAEVAAQLKLSDAELVARIIRDQDFMIREVVLKGLADSTRQLDAAAEGALAVVGSFFALAGPIVAQKRNLPYIPAILQPMTIFSAYDPPIHQGFATIPSRNAGVMVRTWNRLCFWTIRREMHRRYGRAIDAVRRAHALPPQSSTPILDPETALPLRLALYTSALAPKQPDFPCNVEIVGFPSFDRGEDVADTPIVELERFLAAGPAPIVFTLGSLVTSSPGDFFHESVGIARALGMRAILLTGTDAVETGDDVLVLNYAPHSQVFPRAAVVVHHGGIGTTGQALRAGRPQLIVPHMGDQWDNGARVARMGAGRVLGARRYRGERAARILFELMSDRCIGQRAEEIARRLASENGAAAAAAAIARVIDDRNRVRI